MVRRKMLDAGPRFVRIGRREEILPWDFQACVRRGVAFAIAWMVHARQAYGTILPVADLSRLRLHSVCLGVKWKKTIDDECYSGASTE